MIGGVKTVVEEKESKKTPIFKGLQAHTTIYMFS